MGLIMGSHFQFITQNQFLPATRATVEVALFV